MGGQSITMQLNLPSVPKMASRSIVSGISAAPRSSRLGPEGAIQTLSQPVGTMTSSRVLAGAPFSFGKMSAMVEDGFSTSKMREILDWSSRSTIRTLSPCSASFHASSAATVVFPVPLLLEKTVTTLGF